MRGIDHIASIVHIIERPIFEVREEKALIGAGIDLFHNTFEIDGVGVLGRFCYYDDVGPQIALRAFAQASRRQKHILVIRIVVLGKQDGEPAFYFPVLKGVVEHNYIQPAELFHQFFYALYAVLVHRHVRGGKFVFYLQRLIAAILRNGIFEHFVIPGSFAAIAPAKGRRIKLAAQHAQQILGMRRLARPARAQVANANGLYLIKMRRLQKMRIIQKIAQPGHKAVCQRKRPKHYAQKIFQVKYPINIKNYFNFNSFSPQYNMSKETPENKPENTPEKHEDAEKLFDESQYNTITVGAEDEKEKSPLKEENFVKTLLNLLDSGNPEDKDAALDLLKKENAVDYLMGAVKASQNNDKKAVLLAACWESGLNFKGHHDFFMDFAVHVNPLVSLEAITVLDTNRETIPKEELQPLIDRLTAAIEKKHDNAALLEDLRMALQDQLKGE